MTTENRAAHPVRTGLVAVAMVILLALVVFPGFVAAGLSRESNPPVFFVFNSVWLGTPKSTATGEFMSPGPGRAALRVFFAPANRLMRVSPVMQKFYTWQYELAGGKRHDDW